MATARSTTGPDLLIKDTHAMELLVKVVILKASTICRANDLCKGGNIQTVSAEDVYKVPNEIEFSKFLEPLIKDCIGSGDDLLHTYNSCCQHTAGVAAYFFGLFLLMLLTLTSDSPSWIDGWMDCKVYNTPP